MQGGESHSPSTRLLGAAFCFDQYVRGVGAAIPEIEADATIGKLLDSGGDGAGREIPARGEDYRVAGATEASVED